MSYCGRYLSAHRSVWDLRCGQHTVTFSKSASEEVGDRGLMGLREGELPTLETHSGSGTYRTCKHNSFLHLHRRRLCANTHCDQHTCTGRDKRERLADSCANTKHTNHKASIWTWMNGFRLLTGLSEDRESAYDVELTCQNSQQWEELVFAVNTNHVLINLLRHRPASNVIFFISWCADHFLY